MYLQQSKYPTNLINYEKHNYRKYKQVDVSEKKKPPAADLLQLHSVMHQQSPSRRIMPNAATSTPNKTTSSSSSNTSPRVKFAQVKKIPQFDYFYNSRFVAKPNLIHHNRLLNTMNKLSLHANDDNDNDMYDDYNDCQHGGVKPDEISSSCCPIHYGHAKKKSHLDHDEDCPHMHFSPSALTGCAPNRENRVVDLSGYLIFVTTSHHGDEVKVYG